MQLRADAKALQNPGSVGFRFPAAQLCEFRFKVGSPEAVLIGKIGLFVNGVLFLAMTSYRRWLPMMTVSMTV